MSKQPVVLTPELSKAARRELSFTQSNVIAETGILAYKLKQFEAGRFRPDMNALKVLREFYESHGIDFEQLEEHVSAKSDQIPADEQNAAPVELKRGLTANPRPGFFISDHLPQELVDRVLDRMSENDDQIAELIEGAYERSLFGVISDGTEAKVRELFAAMAESHLLFRFLQGRNIIAAIRDEPKTIGEFLSQWMQQSPAHDVFGSDPADPGAGAGLKPITRAATAETQE